MNALVSIVMPAYNAEKYIVSAIESVIKQTYTNWELIVVDDCSTDTTVKIVQNLLVNDHRIKLIQRDVNSGKPSIAKNEALKHINGIYIAFLDSDDLWVENKLDIQISFMESNKHVELTYTGGYWIDSSDKIIKKFMPKYACGYNLPNQLRRYEINNQSVIITKKALDKTLQKFSENITIGEDYNLFMHIIALYESCAIKEYLVKYRIHENAITKRKKQVTDGVLITLKELDLKYGIKGKYPLFYFVAYLKAIRFKYIKKNWNK